MIEIPTHFETHIEVQEADLFAVDLLVNKTNFSKQYIKKIMQQGAVWLTDKQHVRRLRRAKKILSIGQVIHLYYDKEVLEQVPFPAKLVADLGDYSVWDKPYGMFSQGSKWGDHCTITRWAEQSLIPERPSFTVHRLDRATTGLIIVAHKKKSAAALSTLFQDRQINKRYCAMVQGDFTIATGNNVRRIETEIDGRYAVSNVTLLRYDSKRDQSLLEISIETGRKHQIRRHLADIGFPIIGDRLYGQADEDSIDLQLRANYLSFECPITHQMQEFKLDVDMLLEA